MPCYQVNLISVDIAASNKDLLEQALKALGLDYAHNRDKWTIYTPDGTITIRGDKAELPAPAQVWLNKIKRSYSMKNIETVAKKYKFNITTKADGKIVLRKY